MKKFVILDMEESIGRAMYYLANGHHVIGIQENGVVSRVLGQTEIFEFLRKKTSYINLPLNKILDLGFVGRTKDGKVAQIQADRKSIEAFEEMSTKQFSALVIYKGDKPVGVLSSSYIRVWLNSSKRDLNLLELPVSRFIQELSEVKQQKSHKDP
eukprot:UN32960